MTDINLSLVVVRGKICITTSWIENAMVRAAPRLMKSGVVAGTDFSPEGAVVCAHIRNSRYIKTLKIPTASNCSEKCTDRR